METIHTTAITWGHILFILLISTAGGSFLVGIGSLIFKTKSSCGTERKACLNEVCEKINELSSQITKDKYEAIMRREEMEEKIFKGISSNTTLINNHYAEMKEFIGEAKNLKEFLNDVKDELRSMRNSNANQQINRESNNDKFE